MQNNNKSTDKTKTKQQQHEEDVQLKEDILNGHKKDCPGYEDIYRGIDCNCFDNSEDYTV